MIVCMYLCMYVHMDTHIYICNLGIIYVYVHICVYIRHVCTYISTFILSKCMLYHPPAYVTCTGTWNGFGVREFEVR